LSFCFRVTQASYQLGRLLTVFSCYKINNKSKKRIKTGLHTTGEHCELSELLEVLLEVTLQQVITAPADSVMGRDLRSRKIAPFTDAFVRVLEEVHVFQSQLIGDISLVSEIGPNAV
jgi:hypothetical protein